MRAYGVSGARTRLGGLKYLLARKVAAVIGEDLVIDEAQALL